MVFLDEHVLPRMVYYVREFLPEIFSDRADSTQLVSELKTFLTEFHDKVDAAQTRRTTEGLTMEEIWKLRAAIFGYESVFINILGEAAIKDYVFVRMADILAAYLPEQLMDPSVSLTEKLFFTRNLRVMVAAGLPLPRALATLAGQAKNEKFKAQEL